MNVLNLTQTLSMVLGILLVTGCSTSNPTDKAAVSAKAGVLSESRKLGVVTPTFLALSQDNSRPQGNHDPLLEVAKDGHGMAYIDRIDGQFRVVHNGEQGKLYRMIGDLTISRDGRRVAYAAHINEKFKTIVADKKEGPLFSEMGMPHFTPDGKHLVYTVTQGRDERLVIDQEVHHDYHVSQDLMFSPDSRFIAFAALFPDGRKQFVLTDLTLKDKKVFEGCGESFTASEDRSRLAVVCTDSGRRTIKIVDFVNRSVVTTLDTPTSGNIVRKRFSADNRSFAFSLMTHDYQRFLHFNGRSEEIPKGDEILSDPLVLGAPEKVGVIIGNAFKAKFYTAFTESKPTEKQYGYVSDFVSSPDGRHHAYVAINAGGEERMRIVVNGHEGPVLDKIVSPVFSPDSRFLVYRARDNGRRFMVVSDMKGTVVRRHPDYDMVFQPIFIHNGTSVAYAVLTGNEVWWKVEKL